MMELDTLLIALLIWVLLIPVAIAQGALREAVLKRHMPDYAARLIGSAIMIAAVLIASAIFVASGRAGDSQTERLLVGVLWVALTVLFEFGFGHYVMKHPWPRLLADYNVFHGRVWSLVLLAELLGPFTFGAIL